MSDYYDILKGGILDGITGGNGGGILDGVTGGGGGGILDGITGGIFGGDDEGESIGDLITELFLRVVVGQVGIVILTIGIIAMVRGS